MRQVKDLFNLMNGPYDTHIRDLELFPTQTFKNFSKLFSSLLWQDPASIILKVHSENGKDSREVTST